MTHRRNFLLSRLEPAVLAKIEPHLSIIELHQNDVLAETHQRIEKVYFPHSGIISCVVELVDGGVIETGMIGNDGEFGAGQALDDKVSLNHVVIQVGGRTSVINSDRVREIADDLPAFRALLTKYEHFFLSQVQQTAACNAVHDLQARTCRWLLRMHDLIGVDVPLTHEVLAQMLGVRRPSVTDSVQELQRAGMISCSRGHIHIVNLRKIKQSACECDQDVRSHYSRTFNLSEGLSGIHDPHAALSAVQLLSPSNGSRPRSDFLAAPPADAIIE